MISDYLEDQLPTRDRLRLERHFELCPPCRVYLEQMRQTLTLVGRLVPEDLSGDALDEFTEIYRRWRAEDGQ